MRLWQPTFDRNVLSVFLCCRHGIPALIDSGGGSVINMTSWVASRGIWHKHVYTAAKGAVVSLTRALAGAYGKQGIRVNAIAPGVVRTERSNTQYENPKWNLAADPSPRVRGEALTALGRLGAREAEATLIAGFEDADPAIHERAALALVELGGRRGLDEVLAFVGGEGDEAARAHVAAHLVIPPGEVAHALPVIDATLARLGQDDAAFEPLLEAKVALLEARGGATATPADVDAEIVGAFPSFAHMVKLKGFDALVKSLRTAEALYRSTTGLSDADQSPPIVLWMKCLENYVHAWLGAKLNTVQREPVALFEYVDRVTGAWPGY